MSKLSRIEEQNLISLPEIYGINLMCRS